VCAAKAPVATESAPNIAAVFKYPLCIEIYLDSFFDFSPVKELLCSFSV
jgi:hypothetical protein